MSRKKEISIDDLAVIMRLAMEASEMPFPELSFDIDDQVIDLSVLPPPLSSVLGKKAAPEAMMLPISGTHPICIRVPTRVIRAFKLRAAATGCSYQTLMNRALSVTAKGYV